MCLVVSVLRNVEVDLGKPVSTDGRQQEDCGCELETVKPSYC